MATLAATNKQVPDNSILDHFDKQTYLGNRFSASHTFTVGTSETALLLLQNIQTGNQQTLIGLFQDVIKVTENTASDSIILKVYSNPTATAGTAITPVNLRLAYTNIPVATVTYSPTASSNGTLIDVISAAPLGIGESDILKILDNNQSLLITGTASSAGTSVTVILQWREN